jgi:hypothetical protein
MAVMIYCNRKIILYSRSSTFEMIYQKIVNRQLEQDLIFPDNVQTLIDYLYNACYGAGSDIADYLKTSSDASFFAKLIKISIEESIHQIPSLTEETKKKLWNFHHEIEAYSKTLKP